MARHRSRAGIGSAGAHPLPLAGRPALAFVATLVGALVGALLIAPHAAEAVEILPSDLQRTIVADALTSRDLEFSIETNGDGVLDVLPFDEVVLASASLVDVSADADADQLSQIELTELMATGVVNANVSIAPSVTEASTSAKGESIYRVVFSVDVATTFVLSGDVIASALPAQGQSFAIVELIDLDQLDILFSFVQNGAGTTNFSEVIDLVPGVNYEIYASSLAIAEGLSPDTTEAISASYSVSLLPEPGMLSGILAGFLALGLLERRRGSRTR